MEYETVNLEVNDPKAALGEKFKGAPASRDGTVSGHHRTASGGSSDTYDKSPVLESGNPAPVAR